MVKLESGLHELGMSSTEKGRRVMDRIVGNFSVATFAEDERIAEENHNGKAAAYSTYSAPFSTN
jgi:hypothetical protein